MKYIVVEARYGNQSLRVLVAENDLNNTALEVMPTYVRQPAGKFGKTAAIVQRENITANYGILPPRY